jgi:hypothetical protein
MGYILQSDWFSTSRVLAHILIVEKNEMAAQTEFPKCFAVYCLHRIKNTTKNLAQIPYRLGNEF